MILNPINLSRNLLFFTTSEELFRLVVTKTRERMNEKLTFGPDSLSVFPESFSLLSVRDFAFSERDKHHHHVLI